MEQVIKFESYYPEHRVAIFGRWVIVDVYGDAFYGFYVNDEDEMLNDQTLSDLSEIMEFCSAGWHDRRLNTLMDHVDEVTDGVRRRGHYRDKDGNNYSVMPDYNQGKYTWVTVRTRPESVRSNRFNIITSPALPKCDNREEAQVLLDRYAAPKKWVLVREEVLP